jgi:hypothetical protein
MDFWSLDLLSFVLVCASNQKFHSRPFHVVSFPFRSVRCNVCGSSQFDESRNLTFHFAKDTKVFFFNCVVKNVTEPRLGVTVEWRDRLTDLPILKASMNTP